MMICTAKFENVVKSGLKLISISDKKDDNNDFKVDKYYKLIPNIDFYNMVLKEKENLSEEEWSKFYIKEYWEKVLCELDPFEVIKELACSIVVSSEDNDMLSNRHIVSAWLELFLGEEIYEVSADENDAVVLSKPEYVKDMLEEVIKECTDMKGFNSVQAFCFFQNSIYYEELANIYENEGKFEYAYELRKISDNLRISSIEFEKSYKIKKRIR